MPDTRLFSGPDGTRHILRDFADRDTARREVA